MPRRTIAAVVIAFSTALVAEPALSRVEPVRTSGPVGIAITTSASARRPGPGRAGDEHGRRAASPRGRERAAHERRHRAGRDADQQVARPERAALAPSDVLAVLGALDRLEHRALAARP